MVYNFRINCIIRVCLISATIFLFFYVMMHSELYATIFFIAGLIIYQVFSLIRFVEKTNRTVSRFLESIKYSDFSQSFTSTLRGKTFDRLNNVFNEVIKEFQHTRAEKEESFRYLQTVIQHVGIGLIAFKENGDIDLINNAAKRILKKAQLKNIKQLESISKDFSKLTDLHSGEKTLIKLHEEDDWLQLVIYASEFIMRQQKYKLISIQNIQSELEEKEMEAWQNLIRVLTHEIMNSVTPISSLASTANSMLTLHCEDTEASNPIYYETLHDVCTAVRTIENRSKGLLHFVENYRQLTRIPRPNYKIIKIAELLDQVLHLMKAQIEKNRIVLNLNIVPQDLEVLADPDLIEQVLINLFKNAIEAVAKKSKATIQVNANVNGRGRVNIRISDNGPGINSDVIERIFIPFFTTKKQGSGIGLSLARQVMRLHGGTISVKSQPHVETVFTLRF